ncbi:MAG: acetate/propionate family kinase [Deltaproteobacteria bacterium]|nr:acetate/propionate family kinase [Deltaproteobacteria bacterium]
MEDEHRKKILTINSGSSSIKFSLYRMEKEEERILTGEMQGIGPDGGLFSARNGEGETWIHEERSLPDHGTAMRLLLDRLRGQALDRDLDAVGHRVVHGGIRHSRPERITPGLLAELKRLTPFVPEHLPHELSAIETIGRDYPALAQVACFDTMFHRRMPPVAQRYPFPGDLFGNGVLRYGFHGLSYEYIMEVLKQEAGREAAAGRIIIAHLGHGASMAAVHKGQCLDTTMGFTPAGGLVMSTRSGDLDPGLLLYLLEQKRMTPRELNELVNRRSGLLGVSGTSGDMKELLAKEEKDPRAKDAVDLFCYQARKFLGGLTAALGGLDTLVFTGGIGEHAAKIRRRICDGLEFLELTLDPERNRSHAPIISASGSRVTVRVTHTNEELMIARHTAYLLRNVAP